ncbi:hypothetical protein Tco_0926847 [Tanacetum coccineum]|uniref:Uncharacterized protein n=1 Tax=Tanacetum coccineum TaxID=301880 RepID=A0ABQ5DBS9_9ASTR
MPPTALYDSQLEVACLMLTSMSLELQKNLVNYNAYDMLQERKTMFEEHARQELFETTIAELHTMLKLIEKDIPKKADTPYVLAIIGGKIQKDKNEPRGAKGKGNTYDGNIFLYYCPGVLGGNTHDGNIVLYYCPGVLGGNTYDGYGYCKNLEKTVKTRETRTRERKSTQRAGRMLSKVNSGQLKSNMSLTSQEAPIGQFPKENDTRGLKKAHKEWGFYTKTLTKEAQRPLTHGCHVGNPCAPKSNPTVQVKHQMIEGMKGQDPRKARRPRSIFGRL